MLKYSVSRLAGAISLEVSRLWLLRAVMGDARFSGDRAAWITALIGQNTEIKRQMQPQFAWERQ